MKDIKKMHKLRNNSYFMMSALSLMFISCHKNNEFYLKSDIDRNTQYLIKNINDTIFINEIFNEKGKKIITTKKLVKINDSYYTDKDTIDTDNSYPFLSLKKNKKLQEDKFSLLNDSIITGLKNGNNFYTEIKSNNKPVNYKYYYDENYHINKIVYVIGNKTYIYK